MKKCPKCGTILDDSKKKCYMCGADLTASSSVSDFSSNFDNRIGSSVTRGVDNVFNNGKDIDVDSKDIIGNKKSHNNGSFFSHNSSSRDFFGGEINKLNSMTFDERSKSEKKINNFFGKNDLKSKDEINSKKKKKKNKNEKPEGKVKKISYSTNPTVPKKMQEAMEEKVETKKKEDAFSSNMFFAGKDETKVIKAEELKKEEKRDNHDHSDVPDAFKSFNSFKKKESDINSQERKKEFFPSLGSSTHDSDTEEKSRQFFSSLEKDKGEEKKDNFFGSIVNKISSIKPGNKNNKKLSNEKVQSAFAMFNNNSDYNNADDVEVDFYGSKSDSSNNQTNLNTLKKPSYNPFDSLKGKFFSRGSAIELREIGRMIFNSICVVLFIIMLVFVYFRFIKIDSTEQLDGLQYKVPNYFKLNRTDSHEKFYVSKEYGNICSFEVLSGTVADPNGYVENYFQYVKSLYASDEKAIPTMQEMKINGNTWRTEKFIYLPEEGQPVSSDTVIPRYSYTIITYNGSFYVVRATNKDENKKCYDEYMKFMNSMEFVESNVK